MVDMVWEMADRMETMPLAYDRGSDGGGLMMAMKRIFGFLMLVGLAAFAGEVFGQDAPATGSKAVFDNASAGAVAARAPGNMVSAAIARHQERQNENFNTPEITEPGPTADGDSNPIADQLKRDLLTQIVNDITLAIVAINNLFRTGIGLPPDIPNLSSTAAGSSLSGVDLSGLDASLLTGG